MRQKTTKPDMIRNLTKTVIIVHPGFHESQKGRFVREDKPRAASKLPNFAQSRLLLKDLPKDLSKQRRFLNTQEGCIIYDIRSSMQASTCTSISFS